MVHGRARHVSFSAPLTVFEAGATAVILLVVSLLLTCLYISWQAVSVLRVVRGKALDPVRDLSDAWRPVLRVGGVVLIGIVGIMLPVLSVLAVGHSMNTLAFVGLVSIVWVLVFGYFSVAWLPFVVDGRRPFWRSLGSATGAARKLGSSWIWLMVVWSAALGVFTWHQFSLEMPGNHHYGAKWQVSLKWFGAFPSETEWYGNLVSEAKVAPLGWFDLPLTLLFLVVAIAVKCIVFERLDSVRED